jgi:diacylglycerol O-acyltransferase / wax synthase
MRQLTSLDAQFLAIETPRTWGHVSGLAILDPSTAPGGRLELEDVCRVVGERLHLLPPFRWRLVWVPFGLDHPYWIEDPDFDIDFHIRESAVPPPGDDRQLAETVSRIVARPLDRRHPLWELYLIHGLESGHVAMLTKIHHAAVDGVSGAEITSTLLDLDPSGREIPPPPARASGERKPGQIEMLGRGLIGAPRQPLRAARTMPTMLANLGGLPGVDIVPGVSTLGRAITRTRRIVSGSRDGEVLEQPTTQPPRTRFNARITPHRRYSFGQLSLDRIKAIKNELGITVNDVVVALCASGLRSWLLERDELPDDPLVAMVPVSVRTQEQMGTFGNRVSAMFAPIPTDEPDPVERLRRSHDILRAAKERHRALPATLLQDATQFIPPAVFARAARVVTQLAAAPGVRPALNLVISNVPGPRVPLYCGGAQLVANYPVSVIADGVGLNITCMSYLDHVDFGIVVDREQVDDAWPLMDGLHAALEEFDQIVCGGKRARPRTEAPKPV